MNKNGRWMALATIHLAAVVLVSCSDTGVNTGNNTLTNQRDAAWCNECDYCP